MGGGRVENCLSSFWEKYFDNSGLLRIYDIYSKTEIDFWTISKKKTTKKQIVWMYREA